MKFLKIGNEIINLAHVQNITLHTSDNGRKVLFYTDFSTGQVSYAAYGNTAEYVWNWLNEHLDMTVCPMPKEVQA